MVLRALAWGADGVLVVGCHPGGCHSVDGNVKAARRVELLRALLAQLGFGEDRVEVLWTGASEGKRLAEEVDRFVGRIRELGPLPRPDGQVPGRRTSFPGEGLLAAGDAP
jgi:F420-non-reducing hydrogenase iron-sulfur subunit